MYMENFDIKNFCVGYDSSDIFMKIAEDQWIGDIQKTIISEAEIGCRNCNGGKNLFFKCCDDIGLVLKTYKEKGNSFLSVETKDFREYISCSETFGDVNYTRESLQDIGKRSFYSYKNNSGVVLSNSYRIISLFDEFSGLRSTSLNSEDTIF